jgi:hypothetical protein
MTTRSDEALMTAVAGPTVTAPVSGAHLWRLTAHFALVLCFVSGVAAAFGGRRAAVSGALGVLLAGLNLLLMRRIMGALAGAGGGSAAWAIALPFKLVGLVAAAFTLVELRIAQPVPLAIGFALLPLTGVFLPAASSVPRDTFSSSPARPGQHLK